MNPDHTLGDIAPLMASLGKLRQKIVLYGAGACGGYALRHLRAKGIEPLAIVDSNSAKWGTAMPKSTLRDGIEGIEIISPEVAKVLYPDAEWVACAISRPAAPEIRAQLKAMGVKTKPLWEVLPVCHGPMPNRAFNTLMHQVCADEASRTELCDQLDFRIAPDYDDQDDPSDIKDIYFPDFITHLDDEHFVDCGAADGDTIREFRSRWPKFDRISAFEPDVANYEKMCEDADHLVTPFNNAVGDCIADVAFAANGDYSSHIGANGSEIVRCVTLGAIFFDYPPTYIKMDIEGAELEALWGARRILREHSPVLAVCAYHTSDHLWQIPLLIHAIQPDYRLYFRRYGEGAFELIWYAVPPERVK